MITLYDSMTTDFNNNGLVVLNDCISCNTTERLNGLYELTLEFPIDGLNKWQYLVEGNIIKNSDGQLFRIYYKQKTLNSILVNCRHIFYDLLNNFIVVATITNMDGASALNAILSNTQFAHGFTNMSDISTVGSLTISKTNPVDAILGQGNLIDTFGGELVRNNFDIQLLNARGLNRGVLVAYGKNIQGIQETLDMSNLITRIYPTGKDGLTITEGYVDSPYINNYPSPVVKEVKFDTIETEAELRTATQNYFVSSKCDIPMVNYTVDFLELTKTVEYQNYSVLETVYMGDTVTIRHEILGIDIKAKVITINKNDLTNTIDSVELGNFKIDFASGITNSFTQVKSDITETKSSLQLAIDNATNQINSALGGYVVKRNGELLIMDTEDVNTATEVARWNLNGLGFSNTGYNGSFRTAITRDGHIVADFIDTGTLNASLITVQGLVVGNNVTMGANATIGWGQVTGTPNLTKIDANGIYTGTVSANQINGGTISASISITSPSISGGNISGVTITGSTIAARDVLKVSSNVWNAGTSNGLQFGDTLGGYSAPATIKYTQGISGDGTSNLTVSALQITLSGITYAQNINANGHTITASTFSGDLSGDLNNTIVNMAGGCYLEALSDGLRLHWNSNSYFYIGTSGAYAVVNGTWHDLTI